MRASERRRASALTACVAGERSEPPLRRHRAPPPFAGSPPPRRPRTRVEDIAGELVGLHATDPATVYLSLQQRLADFTPADLDDALYERRSLTRLLGMRRTMFVVPLDLAAVVEAAAPVP